MKRTITILLLLAAPAFAGDFEKAKAAFKQAVLRMDEGGVKSAADDLAASDRREAVDVLLDGYGLTAGQLKQLWAEKQKWIREMDANADIEWDTGPQGSTPAPGSVSKYQKLVEAQKKGKEVEARIMKIEGVKRSIVEALAAFRSDAAVRELVGKLKSDSNWERRAGIAEALGRIEHGDAAPALLAQLKKESEPGVKIACIEALRQKKIADDAAVALLADQLRSDFWQVKYCAAVALKESGSKQAVEPLIDALKGADGRLRHDLNDALVALTGVDKHGDYATWRAWWEANKTGVMNDEYAPKDEERPKAENDGRGTTSFYGIPVKTKNVIFVLDHSGSMQWESEWKIGDVATGPGESFSKPEGNRKIDVARWQLKRVLSQLPEATEFNVIIFNSTFRMMSDRMLKMSAGTRKIALEFADRLQPEGGTNIYDPLERAFMFAGVGEGVTKPVRGGVDTIFLLTDGMPNQGQIPDTQAILAKIREMNRNKKLVINTIGVFSSNPPNRMQENEKEDGEKFLKQIADEHGGVFVNASK